jgi:hypothetical protein
MPYFSFCLAHYSTWQCYTTSSGNAALYRTDWALYGAYRLGLSLQLVCLSITVLIWSDFLSYSQRHGAVVAAGTEGHKRLVRMLFFINTLDILGSLYVNGLLMVAPELGEDSSANLSVWVYVNWLFLDSMQVVQRLFLDLQAEETEHRFFSVRIF